MSNTSWYEKSHQHFGARRRALVELPVTRALTQQRQSSWQFKTPKVPNEALLQKRPRRNTGPAGGRRPESIASPPVPSEWKTPSTRWLKTWPASQKDWAQLYRKMRRLRNPSPLQEEALLNALFGEDVQQSTNKTHQQQTAEYRPGHDVPTGRFLNGWGAKLKRSSKALGHRAGQGPVEPTTFAIKSTSSAVGSMPGSDLSAWETSKTNQKSAPTMSNPEVEEVIKLGRSCPTTRTSCCFNG